MHYPGHQARWTKGDPRVFGSSARKGKAPGVGKRSSRSLSDEEFKRCGSSLRMIFPVEEAIKKICPEADWQLCILHAVWDALNNAWKKDRDASAEALKKIYRVEHKRRPRELCGAYGSSRAWFILRSWRAGKLRLMLFWLSCVTKAHPPLPLHEEPTGAGHQGGEEADEGSRGVLRGNAVERLYTWFCIGWTRHGERAGSEDWRKSRVECYCKSTEELCKQAAW